MRDRGTQVVLSVFVGAFAYSTAGLYTVGIQRSGQQEFVPRLAVSGSLALALATLAGAGGALPRPARACVVVPSAFSGYLQAIEPRPLVDAANRALSPAVNDPQLLGEVGSLAVSDDRRAACASHLRLVLQDAKRETAQPADVQAVLEDGTAALRALDADQDRP